MNAESRKTTAVAGKPKIKTKKTKSGYTVQLDQAIDYTLAQVKRVGNPIKLSTPLQTLLLVHHAQGIIDNGGLQYFFESDFPDQPPYSLFVDAYRAIGAEAEAQALADAVSLFPFAEPHRRRYLRNRFLQRFLDGGGHRPDSPFEPYTDKLCGNKEVWRLLERYVRCHKDSFVK